MNPTEYWFSLNSYKTQASLVDRIVVKLSVLNHKLLRNKVLYNVMLERIGCGYKEIRLDDEDKSFYKTSL
jgi:hypothetical protein